MLPGGEQLRVTVALQVQTWCLEGGNARQCRAWAIVYSRTVGGEVGTKGCVQGAVRSVVWLLGGVEGVQGPLEVV